MKQTPESRLLFEVVKTACVDLVSGLELYNKRFADLEAHGHLDHWYYRKKYSKKHPILGEMWLINLYAGRSCGKLLSADELDDLEQAFCFLFDDGHQCELGLARDLLDLVFGVGLTRRSVSAFVKNSIGGPAAEAFNRAMEEVKAEGSHAHRRGQQTVNLWGQSLWRFDSSTPHREATQGFIGTQHKTVASRLFNRR